MAKKPLKANSTVVSLGIEIQARKFPTHDRNASNSGVLIIDMSGILKKNIVGLEGIMIPPETKL